MIYKWEDIREEVRIERERWRSERDKWLKRGDACEEFYACNVDGTYTTYTKEQLEILKKNGLAPISLNTEYSQISQFISLLSNVKPSFKLSVMDNSEQMLQLRDKLEEVLKYVLYYSNERMIVSQAIKDMVIRGIGALFVDKMEGSDIGVGLRYISPENLILDINSRDVTLRDMEGFWYEKEITGRKFDIVYSGLLEIIQGLYPDKKVSKDALLVNSSGLKGKSRISGSYNKEKGFEKYVVSEYYYKKYTMMLLINNPETKQIQRVFLENLSDDMLPAIEQLVVGQEMGEFICRDTYVNDKLILSEVMPLKEFPIGIMLYEWNGSIYNSFGLVHYMIDNENVINKAIQLMVMNGQLLNNAGYIAPIGGIPEHVRLSWQQMGNKPGVVKEYNPVVVDGAVLKPEREPIGNISNFYPELINLLKQVAIETTGMYPNLQGDPREGRIDIFSSLQQYQQLAMQRINKQSSNINEGLMWIGSSLLEQLINISVPGQVIKYMTQPGQEGEFVVDENVYSMLWQLRYKFLTIPEEGSYNYKMMIANELFKIAQTTQDPVKRDIYITEAINLSEIATLVDLNKKYDITVQLQQQAQQLQNALQEMQKRIQEYENKMLELEYQNKLLSILSSTEKELIKKRFELENKMKEGGNE